MPAARLLKPHLYKPADGTPAAGARCTLSGGRCTCGYVFFPMQTYGCEQCGRTGEALQPADIAGSGTLLASAVVHTHPGEREAPFIVGTIQLNDGPVVRTLIDYSVEAAPLKPGQAVEAVLSPVGESAEGEPLLDLRFVPVGDARQE